MYSQQLPLTMREASQQLLLHRLCLLLAAVAVRSRAPAFQQLAQSALGLFDKSNGAPEEVCLSVCIEFVGFASPGVEKYVLWHVGASRHGWMRCVYEYGTLWGP